MPTKTIMDFPRQATKVFRDEAVIAVISASLLSPFIVPKINSMMDSVPILRDHKSFAALIAGFITFTAIAPVAKENSILRGAIIGVAGSFLLTAVLPLYSQLTARSAS